MLHYVALFPRTAVTFAVVIGKDCSGQSLGHCGALFGCGQVAHFESQKRHKSTMSSLAGRARSFWLRPEAPQNFLGR